MIIAFAGCSNDVQKRVEAAMAKINTADSLQATVALYGTIKVSAQGQTAQLPIKISAEIKALTKAKKYQIVVSMNFMTMSQVLAELYMEQLDNGTVRMVSHDVANGKWTAQIVDAKTAFGGADPSAVTSFDAKTFSSMKIVDKETINGVNYDVVEFKLNMEKLTQVLDQQIAKQSPLPSGAADIITGLKTAIADSPFRLWLSKSGESIYKLKWDLSKLGTALIDLAKEQLGESLLKDNELAEQLKSISIVDLYIEIVYDKVGGVETFTIPDVPVKTT
jgi:hypothetical protein